MSHDCRQMGCDSPHYAECLCDRCDVCHASHDLTDWTIYPTCQYCQDELEIWAELIEQEAVSHEKTQCH